MLESVFLFFSLNPFQLCVNESINKGEGTTNFCLVPGTNSTIVALFIYLFFLLRKVKRRKLKQTCARFVPKTERRTITVNNKITSCADRVLFAAQSEFHKNEFFAFGENVATRCGDFI